MQLNVAYSCNEAYIHHTGISIISLLENNKDFETIRVYFIEKDVSSCSIEILHNIVESYNRKLIVVPFDEICYDLEIKDTGRHIETIYAKLYFSRLQDIDKILYIDSDTVIVGSLQSLWEINIDNYLLAGVETYTVDVKRELDLSANENFINDGIAFLNLKNMRDQNMITKFNKLIADYNGNPPLLSEGVVNKACKGKILSIHPKYNLMSGLFMMKGRKSFDQKLLSNYYSESIIQEALDKPIVIHYLAAFYNRPWDKNCTHPMKEKYLYYKSISPWKNLRLTNRKLGIRLRVIGFLYEKLPENLFFSLKKLVKMNN